MAITFAAAIPLAKHAEAAHPAAFPHPQPIEQEQGILGRPRVCEATRPE